MKTPQTLDEAAAALHQVTQAREFPGMGNSPNAKSAQLFEQVLRIPASGSGQFVQHNDEVGTIDHLVSAAVGGERTLKPFLEQTEDQFKAAYDKLWGYAKVVRTGAPYLAADGAVTLVSGSPARKIRPAQSPLSCVGASVENLVRCLAVEMAPIRVNVVSPGTVDTAMFDAMGDAKEANLAAMTTSHLIPRAGTSEEVADGILFVMQNRFVTGIIVDVDGGRILS